MNEIHGALEGFFLLILIFIVCKASRLNQKVLKSLTDISQHPYGKYGKHICDFKGQPIVKGKSGGNIRKCKYEGCYFVSMQNDDGNWLKQ